MTLPAPDSSPLQPSTSDESSQALCVVSTVTGRGSDLQRADLRSCWGRRRTSP